MHGSLSLNLDSNLKIRLPRFLGLPSLNFTGCVAVMYVCTFAYCSSSIFHISLISDSVQNSNLNYSSLKRASVPSQSLIVMFL